MAGQRTRRPARQTATVGLLVVAGALGAAGTTHVAPRLATPAPVVADVATLSTLPRFPVPAMQSVPATIPTAANGTATTVEQAVMTKTNAARAKGRKCGTTWMPAVPALKWNNALGRAAYSHSLDMARNNFFSHTGSNGSSFTDRLRAAGYAYRAAGENIAAGQTTPTAVVAAWLASPGHCTNIMRAAFKEIGVGRATGGSYHIYWTQDFGAR